MPTVKISDSAFNDISKLDVKIRARVYKAIEKLSKEIIKPKKLKGKEKGFKVKIGKYRILWDYTGKDINILKVGPRKNIYRNI